MKNQHFKKGPPKRPFMDPSLTFQVTEAYKVARTSLAFSLLKKGCKKVIVTSSLDAEGKSTTSVNLAKSLAQQVDIKVLLIDSDLRRPKIHEYFGLENTVGLTNYLGNMCGVKDVTRPTEEPNLSVICSGVAVPNPSELLASSAMKNLLACLEPYYDYIIMDTSPVNIVVDALPLAKISDGVIIVVRDGISTYPELTKTVETLKMAEAKILGIILNGMKPKPRDCRYRYDRYGKTCEPCP
ncbi:Tyrosine-protein kinase YwqD [Caprobacter fermentans]|uniref:non-specific protein-tyrosine kinase n=1 Tax=Caproicibacter fermentans TaxID=2576756 RepID=A0A6N8HYI0_9FIRM|nr:CpsD/CapB family tyrosine-protein kinase [Caproicibacter fermentans]MVB10728.1 Tyrosine-protein kinase YwqD [Caproicibacter fermentans]